jgi:mRNA interferase HigB
MILIIFPLAGALIARYHPDAASEIKAWVGIVEAVPWHNFAEVRGRFKDADCVDGYVTFNIRQNRYRLITVVHYSKRTDEKQTEGHVYIRSFLTHKEYDNRSNWDGRELVGSSSFDLALILIRTELHPRTHIPCPTRPTRFAGVAARRGRRLPKRPPLSSGSIRWECLWNATPAF